MIPHHRIDHCQSTGISFEEGKAVVNLRLRAQKTGIDAGEIQTQPLIVGKGLWQIISQILKSNFAESSRMGGEDGSGNRASLDAHGGQNGHDDR